MFEKEISGDSSKPTPKPAINSAMSFQDFIYWIQGYFEISGRSELNRQQLLIIKEHLDLVARGKSTLRSNELTFCSDAYRRVTGWISKLQFGQTISGPEVEDWKQQIYRQFDHLNPKFDSTPNPFLAGYEPLGDVYNQRLC